MLTIQLDNNLMSSDIIKAIKAILKTQPKNYYSISNSLVDEVSELEREYKKDIKKYKNKPEILKEINEVINKLARDEVLEPRFFDHQLKGNESEFRECHIKPDLLLKYKKNDVFFILIAVRLGSHSQIF